MAWGVDKVDELAAPRQPLNSGYAPTARASGLMRLTKGPSLCKRPVRWALVPEVRQIDTVRRRTDQTIGGFFLDRPTSRSGPLRSAFWQLTNVRSRPDPGPQLRPKPRS